jgi:cell division protein ZapA (FtsZ GTPase activity inhibitor)
MKKFLLMTVAAFCMCLAACTSGPTGDVAKDAKAAGEKVISIMKGIKSMDDMKKAEEEISKVQKEYEDFYKAKGEEELKKFNEALENDKELNAEMEKVQEELMKNLMK